MPGAAAHITGGQVLMNTIYYDPAFSDEQRRRSLFDGQLIVYAPRPSSLAFVTFARNMIREAFASLDPETAQYQMSVEQYAASRCS
jgi:hypothetical protein